MFTKTIELPFLDIYQNMQYCIDMLQDIGEIIKIIEYSENTSTGEAKLVLVLQYEQKEEEGTLEKD